MPHDGKPSNNLTETTHQEQIMISKYHIEYGIEFGGHREAHVRDFQTDDPVTCESFLVALLEGGLKILTIKHEGITLAQHESDALVKNAATTHLRRSTLGTPSA